MRAALLSTGEFSGFAFGANVGWINLGAGYLKTDSITCTDTDGDNIGDEWEMFWFGDLTTASNTSDNDNDNDPDKDEYLALTDPKDPLDALSFSNHQLNAGATQMSLTFNSDPARLYILETNDAIKDTWIDVGLGTFPPDAGSETTKMLTFPANTTRKFIRVRAIKPLQP